MKRIRLLLINSIFALILLSSYGCARELYYISDDSGQSDKITEDENYAVEAYKYTKNKETVRNGESEAYTITDRGIIFMPNDGILSVYNPEAGTVNPLCTDPLCTHTPYSGCPYGNCIFTRSVPKIYGDRLYYFVKDEYVKDQIVYKKLSIYSTDEYGQNMKQHYQNDGNYIVDLQVENNMIYFVQQDSENQIILYKIDSKSNKLTKMNIGEDEECVICSFLILNEKIYYVRAGGDLYSCDLDLTNSQFLYNIVYDVSPYGDSVTNTLYFVMYNHLFSYHPVTHEYEAVLSFDENITISNPVVSGRKFYFQCFPQEMFEDLDFKDYAEKIKNYNVLYVWDIDTKITEEYPLPEDFYISALSIVHDGLLISQTMIENENTKKISMRPFYAYYLKNNTLVKFCEARGS